MKEISVSVYVSPVGPLLLGDCEGRLCLCDWGAAGREPIVKRVCKCLGAVIVERQTPLIDRASVELDEFFAGDRQHFDLPLLLAGTEFQKQVWNRLSAIPYGGTVTYGAVAEAVGRPAAVRAVGTAVGANAMSVILPCHRILPAGGGVGGYAGGIEAKRFLLGLERGTGAKSSSSRD